MRKYPRVSKKLVVILATGMLALTAACGSGGTTSGSSGDSVDLAPYKARVSAAQAALTDIKFPGPTKAFKAPRGIKLAIVACSTSTEGCNDGAEAVKTAAKVLGWKSQIFDGKNDPITQGQVIEQAVNSGFQAIMLITVDPNVVKGALKIAAKKGVPVGSYCQFVAPSPQGVAFDVGADWAANGKAMGDQIVAETKGKARLLVMYDREFDSTTVLHDATIKEVKTCSTCSVAPSQDFVAADVGPQLGVRVVNILQNDPKINVVDMGYDGASAVVVPAIKQAGLGNKVRVISSNGGAQNIKWVKNGDVQTTDSVFSFTYTAYASVDQMARLLAHQPLIKTPGVSDERMAYTEGVPFALVTKANVKDVKIGPVGAIFAVDNTLKSQYGKLWGVTS